MTRWRWDHSQFSKGVVLTKLLLKGVGIVQFKKEPLHTNYRLIAGVTARPNCCFSFWEMGPADLWPKCNVPWCWQKGERDGTEIRQSSYGPQTTGGGGGVGKVTDRSQSVVRQHKFTTQGECKILKPLLRCTADIGVRLCWHCSAPCVCMLF